MTLRVAFIDDHDIVRSGFVQLLSLEADIQVVGEFSSAAQARAGLPGLEAEICICDISMPDGSGLDLLADIPSGIRVVMLSMHDNPALVEMALERGASRPMPLGGAQSLLQRDATAVWKIALAVSVLVNALLVYWLLFLPR